MWRRVDRHLFLLNIIELNGAFRGATGPGCFPEGRPGDRCLCGYQENKTNPTIELPQVIGLSVEPGLNCASLTSRVLVARRTTSFMWAMGMVKLHTDET